MTESQLDRRLRDWLTDREPGPVPTSLREQASRVPYDAPVPAIRRVVGAVARPAGAHGHGPSLRLAIAIALVGLLLAAAVGTMVVRAPRPAVALEQTSWRDFVVGQPAPSLEFRSVAGALSDRDDATLEFEDLVGSIVVLYFPDPDARPGPTDVGALVETTLAAPESRAFIVAAPIEWSRAINADPGVVTAEPPPGWEAAHAEAGPAILVVDRDGVVVATFAETLPTPDQLADVLASAEMTR